MCGFSQLTPIFSLGDLYVSDFATETTAEHIKAPLELVLCNEHEGGCGLLQLKHTVDNEQMYRNYWYRSGMNATMTSELNGIASSVATIAGLKSGDAVIDIGANDGVLLRGYQIPGLRTIGFEPARNLIKYASQGTTQIINDFFNATAWKSSYGSQKAQAITAIAMFYDLEDPNAFVADVAECLDSAGVFVIQMSYLPLMLSQNAFDNICHEHLEYYSLLSLENLLRRHKLEVFDVQLNEINGGSFRVYICHADARHNIKAPIGADIRVASLRAYEHELGLSDRAVYDAFAERINALKTQVCSFINQERDKGKKVYVYGASTKGNTLLQFFNLNHTIIPAAAERNTDKWGKKTIATMIPIISEEQARQEKPDYFLVLPWHFIDEFVRRENQYLLAGGKFIVPCPEYKIIEKLN